MNETDNWQVLFYPTSSPPAFCIDMMAGAAAAMLDHEMTLKVEFMLRMVEQEGRSLGS